MLNRRLGPAHCEVPVTLDGPSLPAAQARAIACVLEGKGTSRPAPKPQARRWPRADPLAEGLGQLDGYLDGLALETGWLVIFDRRTGQPPLAPARPRSRVRRAGVSPWCVPEPGKSI
jgi:hypothetical protein